MRKKTRRNGGKIKLSKQFREGLTYVFTVKKYDEWRRRNNIKRRSIHKKLANGQIIIRFEERLGETGNGIFVTPEWCKCVSN